MITIMIEVTKPSKHTEDFLSNPNTFGDGTGIDAWQLG